MTQAAAKASLRRQAARARRLAHAAAPDRPWAALQAFLAPQAGRILSGYLPIRSEIDPRPAMAAHAGPVCVPVVQGPGLPLRFRAWSPDAVLEPGVFGAAVPATGDWMDPEVLIVPLLAFDRRGCRLGYGGGFYDRTLAALRRRGPVLAVGFAYAAQEVDRVPTDATDQPLDALVTEAGPLPLTPAT